MGIGLTVIATFVLLVSLPGLICWLFTSIKCPKCEQKCSFYGFSLADCRAYRCKQCKREWAVLCGRVVPEGSLWM